ncbi:MAG: histidinol dehydrogenase, partial [Sedimentisphaerales bacterium]|nr:histidinol dehydrogenase [Sedimentisphaerales bacterium]
MVKELNQLIISSSEPGFEEKINNLRNKLSFAGYISSHPEVVKQVTDIVGDVAFRGDEAVAGYTEKFDNVKLSANQLRISKEQLKQAHSQIDSELLKSLRRAIDNVRKYHSAIFIGRLKHPAGIKYTPLKRVGICVPGASAPLPSTVIMTAVPAMV